MQDAPYSTSFVLYMDGLRCSHTVRSEGGSETHVAEVVELINSLEASGWSKSEAGVPDGCHKEQADGYVVGEDKDGNPKLWFYKRGLQFTVRGGTVYHDHFKSLPFDVDQSRRVELDQPPSFERAEEKGWLIPCDVTLITKSTGKQTQAGKEIHRLQEVIPRGGVPAKPKDRPKLSPEQLTERIIAYVSDTSKVKNQADIIEAWGKAEPRKDEVGDGWSKVQKAFRSRFVSELNVADNCKEVGAYAGCLILVQKIQGAFSESDYEEQVNELKRKKQEAAAAIANAESDASAETADCDFP